MGTLKFEKGKRAIVLKLEDYVVTQRSKIFKDMHGGTQLCVETCCFEENVSICHWKTTSWWHYVNDAQSFNLARLVMVQYSNIILKIMIEIGHVATTLAQQSMENAILESHREITRRIQC